MREQESDQALERKDDRGKGSTGTLGFTHADPSIPPTKTEAAPLSRETRSWGYEESERAGSSNEALKVKGFEITPFTFPVDSPQDHPIFRIFPSGTSSAQLVSYIDAIPPIASCAWL
jgi:hypothetical protein